MSLSYLSARLMRRAGFDDEDEPFPLGFDHSKSQAFVSKYPQSDRDYVMVAFVDDKVSGVKPGIYVGSFDHLDNGKGSWKERAVVIGKAKKLIVPDNRVNTPSKNLNPSLRRILDDIDTSLAT